jgi:DNA-binding SARP family transcriptional activator
MPGEGLSFAVLGPMTVRRGVADLPVGSPQQQAMLAVLLLNAGRSVPLLTLVDALWGDVPPDAATTTVRTYAWRWRRA